MGTFKAIMNALNLSDVIAGSIEAFQMVFQRGAAAYSQRRNGPARQKTGDLNIDTMHLEPLSQSGRDRAWSQGSHTGNDGAYEPQYQQPQYQAPAGPPGGYMEKAHRPPPPNGPPGGYGVMYGPPGGPPEYSSYMEVPEGRGRNNGYSGVSSREASPLRGSTNPRDMV